MHPHVTDKMLTGMLNHKKYAIFSHGQAQVSLDSISEWQYRCKGNFTRVHHSLWQYYIRIIYLDLYYINCVIKMLFVLDLHKRPDDRTNHIGHMYGLFAKESVAFENAISHVSITTF